MNNALDRLLNPRSVAIVGASDDRLRIGGRPIAYMREQGFQGLLLPVNPNRPSIQGLPAFASVAALPQTPDAREVEHYRDLVVHGPLVATLLQALAVDSMANRRLSAFEFKGVQPLFVNQPVVLCADSEGADSLLLRALAPDGRTAMEASAVFDKVG